MNEDDKICNEINEQLSKNINLMQINKKPDVTEEQFNKLIDQAYHFASLPLIKLIKKTINIDLTEKLFEPNHILQKTGEIEMSKINDNKKWVLYLAIVDKDYNLDFGSFKEDKEATQSIITQCLRIVSFAQILFEYIRNNTKELLEYHLILDNNSTLYLDINCKKRIGIKFECRNI